MRILIIEDEQKTAAFLAKGLREARFSVAVARDGETGLQQARADKFDLLIVDIMLPQKDGMEVVRELRTSHVRTPVLFLTARDSVRDRVKGLELGAEHVWGIGFKTDTNVVDVVVRRLRSKVDDPFKTKLIHTIRGVGYVLKAH